MRLAQKKTSALVVTLGSELPAKTALKLRQVTRSILVTMEEKSASKDPIVYSLRTAATDVSMYVLVPFIIYKILDSREGPSQRLYLAQVITGLIWQ